MSRLIRVSGDSTENPYKMVNNLPVNTIIKAGSKIACISAYADILSDTDMEEYIIAEGDTYSYRPHVTDIPLIEVVIPQAVYPGIRGLLNAMQVAANSVGSENAAWRGIHNRWLYRANKCRLEVYQASLGDAGFDDTEDWMVISGNTGLSKTANRLVSDSTQAISIYAGSIVPLASCIYRATVEVVSQFAWNVVEDSDANFVFGMDMDVTENGQYSLTYLDVNGDFDYQTFGYGPSPGDKFVLTKYGNTVHLTVHNALNVLEVDLSQELFPASLVPQSLMYDIEIPQGSQVDLNLCQCTYINQIQPTLLSATKHVAVEMKLNSQLMRRYLGYDELEYIFDGDPAELDALSNPRGLSKYPGVMINIRELSLDSIAGSIGLPSANSSFLGVAQLKDNFNVLEYEPPVPSFLTVKETSNKKTLTITFVQNNETQKPLKFYGIPIVMLQIHDPPE